MEGVEGEAVAAGAVVRRVVEERKRLCAVTHFVNSCRRNKEVDQKRRPIGLRKLIVT